MNKKLIALAVASAVAAPAAMAADVTVYGRINNAIVIADNGSSTTDVSSIGSRFGIKAKSDLGNGLTASARYEFQTTTDKELPNINDLRIGSVGLSGGFGSVTIGNQWSAYFDTVGTDMDAAYSIGGYIYSTVGGGPYRSSNTIKYSNSFGPVYLEADVRLNESDEGADVAEGLRGDGYGIGVRISATDNLTLAAAVDSEEGATSDMDTDRTGVSAKLTAGSMYGMLGFQNYEQGTSETETTTVWVGTTVGSTKFQLGYGTADTGTTEPSALTLGIYHNMGGGVKVYYEGNDVDADDGNGSSNTHILGLRMDF